MNPEAIFIQPHTGCNAKCTICPHSFTYGKRKPESMKGNIWEKIVCDIGKMNFKGQVGLYLHCEPYMERALFGRIKQINSETDAFVVLSTNGSLLTDENIKKTIKARPRKVHINIPSNEALLYRDITDLGLPLIYNNTKKFIQRAKEKIDIEINCPVTKDVDIDLLKKMFHDIKVNTQYWAVSRGGLLKNVNAKGKNNRFRGDHCFQPKENICILHNGDAILCCNDWAGETRGLFGNVMKESIQDIYEGKLMWEVRNEFRAGDYSRFGICRKCSEEMGWT